MSKDMKTETFEKTLERLEALVKTMEEGGQPLEDMLRLYEEGIALSGKLQGQLLKAQGRLAELKLTGTAADGMEASVEMVEVTIENVPAEDMP